MLRATSTHKEYGDKHGISGSGMEDHAPSWPLEVACHLLLRALLDKPAVAPAVARFDDARKIVLMLPER